MSQYSALVNQNKVFTATGTTTGADGAGQVFYLTITGWPNFAKLKRVIITSSSGTLANPTIDVLNNGAGFRSDSNTARILATATATAASGRAAVDFVDAYIEDELRTNCLYLRISFAAPPDAAVTLTCKCEGTPVQTSSISDSGDTGIRFDRSFRVLRQPASGNAVDITSEMLQNGNPYGLGGNSNSLNTLTLLDSNEKIYVGSDKIFTGIMTHPHTSWSMPAGKTLTAEYWNGSTWASLTVVNNTSDGQSSASTFSFPGAIKWAAPAAWRKSQIATDPLKVQMDAIIAGTAYPVSLTNPDRYWVRFSIASQSTVLRMISIKPLE